jgi:phage baseplate assembly protein W
MATLTQTYGVVLPIAHGPQGFFNQSYTSVDQIKTNLKMLLMTKKGERRMNPEFGSSLWEILFENFNNNIYSVVENTIRNDISRWMNYVNISQIEIDTNSTENSDKHKINVKILFTVPSVGINKPQTLEMYMNTSNI